MRSSRPGQGGQDADVGLVAAREGEGGGPVEEGARARLEGAVRREVAADEAGSRGAEAVAGRGLGGGGREGRVGSKAEVVVRAEREHGPAAESRDGRASDRPPPGRRAGGRSAASASSSASSMARTTARSDSSGRVFHVEQSSRGDDLDERAAAVEVDSRSGSSGSASAVVSANTRPPGRTSRAPSASHFCGASVAREIATSNAQATGPRHRPCEASPRRDADRHAVARARARGSRCAGTPPSSRSARTARPSARGRSSASGIAGRPPPLPTSTTRAGWSSLRASANASGKMLADQRLDRSRGRQVDARVPAQQQLGVSSTAAAMSVVARKPSSRRRARARARACVASASCLCREHRAARIITPDAGTGVVQAKSQQHFVRQKTAYTHGPWDAAAADRGSARADDPGRRQRRIDAPNPRSQLAARRVRGARREQRRGGRQAPRRSSRSGDRRRRRSRGPRFLPPRQARRRDGAGGGADARPGRREQAPRPGGGRRRFRRASDLRAGGGRAIARAACSGAIASGWSNRRTTTSASSAPIEDVPLVDLLRAIAANQKSGVAVVMGGEGARGELYFRQGRVVDARGRPSVGPRRDLPPLLLVVGHARRRVEEHPAQGHHRDGDARSPDGGAATRGRVAAAARGRAAARHDLRGRLPAARRAPRRHPRRGEPHPASVRRRAHLRAGRSTTAACRTSTRWPRSASSIASGSSTTSAFPSTRTRRSAPTWKAGCRTPRGRSARRARQERDLFGAGPDPGVGVHGRRTAPIDPLGEDAREALDDDMRVRFTDRLQAEGAAEAADANVLADAASAAADAADTTAAAPAWRQRRGIPQVPLEALIDSAPAGNGAGPTTLPGMGAAKERRVARGQRDGGRRHRCRGRRAQLARRCVGVATSTTLPASPPPPPAAPRRRRRSNARTGGRAKRGQPRSASGEIHVQKLPPSRQSQVDVPRVHVREDSAKAYVRKSTATPPGSARALDEPPPSAVRCPRRAASRTRTSRPSHRPSWSRSRSSARSIQVDDGRDERSRRRTRRTSWASRRAGARCSRSPGSAWWSRWARSPRSGNAHKPSLRRRARDEGAGDGAGPGARRSRRRSSRRCRPRPPRRRPPSRPIDTLGVAARKPVAPLGTSREELDERAADPRMARERVSEARPLLSVCRMAFEQNRMRDAEGACTAARDANPESAEAHGLLAHSLFNRNKRREALVVGRARGEAEPEAGRRVRDHRRRSPGRRRRRRGAPRLPALPRARAQGIVRGGPARDHRAASRQAVIALTVRA